MESFDKLIFEIKVPKYDMDYFIDEDYDLPESPPLKTPILKFNGFNSPEKYSEYLTNIRNNVINDIKSFISKNKVKDRLNLASMLNELLSDILIIKTSYIEENVGGNVKISHIYARDQYLADFNSFIPKDLSAGLTTYYKIQLEIINSLIREIELSIDNKDQITPTPDKKLLSFKLIGLEGENYKDKVIELKELFDRLKHKNYIDIESTFPDFKKVFEEKVVTKKIIWNGPIGGLYYFIKELIRRGKVNKVKAKWQLTCNCFEKPGKELTPNIFHSTPKPSKLRVDEINKAINPIK